MHLSLKTTSFLFSFVLFSIFITGAARAEINAGESIEWIVADSDIIVCGVITDVRTEKGAGQRVWETATVKVNETLKGEKQDSISFITLYYGHRESPTTWKNEGVEMLLCLVKSECYHALAEGYGKSEWALRIWDSDHSAFRLNDKPANGVYTIDFTVLQERDEIVAAVKKAVAASGKDGRPGRFRVDVPFSTQVFSRLYSGSSVWFYVPLDARLGARARKWLKSEDPEFRHEAVKALRHFKNEKNTVSLKEMLRDDSFFITRRGNARWCVFYVRSEAYDILKEWGIDVAKPIIKERIDDTPPAREATKPEAEKESPAGANPGCPVPSSNVLLYLAVAAIVIFALIGTIVGFSLLRRRFGGKGKPDQM